MIPPAYNFCSQSHRESILSPFVSSCCIKMCYFFHTIWPQDASQLCYQGSNEETVMHLNSGGKTDCGELTNRWWLLALTRHLSRKRQGRLCLWIIFTVHVGLGIWAPYALCSTALNSFPVISSFLAFISSYFTHTWEWKANISVLTWEPSGNLTMSRDKLAMEYSHFSPYIH